jgi:hypothetical protein
MPLGQHWRVPDTGGRCFDALPGTVETLLTGSTPLPCLDLGAHGLPDRADRVALVYLDAFGWRFLERHGDHPLLRRAVSVERLTSQFPSTTAAHVTTVHTGLPVGEHGVYEWHVLEPTLDRLVTPLLFAFTGDGQRGTLGAAGLPLAAIFPDGSPLYRRLGAAGAQPVVVQPAAFQPPGSELVAPSALLAGDARIAGYQAIDEAFELLVTETAREERLFANVYLPHVDELMHEHGPDHAFADEAIEWSLDLLDEALSRLPEGTVVLLTADHGMAPVSPARTAYVDELWPDLESLLRTGADGQPLAPAGSSRDLFLHTLPGRAEEVRDGLAQRLEGRAEAHLTADLGAAGLFGTPSPRLLARLGEVCVLPLLGEAAYWRGGGRFEQRFLGQHGGLSPDEMEIPLVVLRA